MAVGQVERYKCITLPKSLDALFEVGSRYPVVLDVAVGVEAIAHSMKNEHFQWLETEFVKSFYDFSF
jgi:hypothetical protein